MKLPLMICYFILWLFLPAPGRDPAYPTSGGTEHAPVIEDIIQSAPSILKKLNAFRGK